MVLLAELQAFLNDYPGQAAEMNSASPSEACPLTMCLTFNERDT
jgi:hypothetical protein